MNSGILAMGSGETRARCPEVDDAARRLCITGVMAANDPFIHHGMFSGTLYKAFNTNGFRCPIPRVQELCTDDPQQVHAVDFSL
jgi:hypothetical protein